RAVNIGVPRVGIDADGLGRVTRGNTHAEDPCEHERLEECHLLGKVAETLAPEEFRGHPIEGLRADLRTPCAADVPAHTGRNQCLMLRIPKKYVLQADAQVVEPFERYVVLLVQD